MCNNYIFKLFVNALSLAILIPTIVFSQIPNPGFENWSIGIPVDWITNNTDQFPTISQSTISHSGSYSVKGDVASFSGFSFAPVLATAFPYTDRPANFTGFYEFTSISSDTLIIAVALYNNSKPIGGGFFHTAASVNSFTQFTIPIIYVQTASELPDSAGISIMIGPTLSPHAGSGFYIDDLSFSGNATSIYNNNSQASLIFDMKQNYPNPFNPSTTIEYQIPQSSHVSLVVYDVLGNQVVTIVNEVKPAGNYSVNFVAANLASGIYFYKIKAGNYVQTKKLIIVK